MQFLVASVPIALTLVLIGRVLSGVQKGDRSLRLGLVLAGLLAFTLSGGWDLNVYKRAIEPIAQSSPYSGLWLGLGAAAAGALGGWFSVRAAKSDSPRHEYLMILAGTLVVLVMWQLVIGILEVAPPIETAGLVAQGAFGMGFVFYFAFVEDWRTQTNGSVGRIRRVGDRAEH